MRRVACLLAAAGCLAITWPGSATASCAAPALGEPRLADYDHVFAGQVERVTNGGAAAEVSVLDVWHGPDLPPRVVVVGGQLGRGVESSVDRSYRSGARYGFFVQQSDDGSLRDNICTPTRPLKSLSAVDPPGRRLPEASAEAPTDPRGLIARRGLAAMTGATASIGAIAATGLLLRRRRRRRLQP
jgi:hypothetical protein